MSEVDCSQAITCLKDNNESESITSITGRQLISTVAVGLLGLPWKLFFLPISIIGGSVGLVTGSIGLSFRVAGYVLSYWPRMVELTSSSRNRKPSSTALVSASVSTTAEASEAIDFLSELESLYGEIHPTFVPGSFMDAVELSRRECKLLFVYLHSPDNPDTPSFCMETLCSEFLSVFVNENFVSWGDSIRKNEGLEISKSLNASRFPFWAVIKGGTATGEGFSLLRQFEGASSAEEMVTELQSVLEENAPSLVAASVDTTDEHTSSPPMMEEEDAPCSAALEADRGNEFQREEDQNGIETEAESEAKLSEPEQGPKVIQFEEPSSPEEMVTELPSVLEENTTNEHTDNPPLMEEEDAPYPAALEADQADELQSKEDQNGKELEGESDAKVCEEEVALVEPEPEPDIIQVFVRLPIGERIGRSFVSTDTLKSVYEFVDSSGWLDVGRYTLVSFFPRVLYGQDQLSSTLEQLGLNPQTSLFVELDY